MNIPLFRSPKFQPLKCPIPDEIRLERSDVGGRYFETVLRARPCLCDIIPSNSKVGGKEKNLQLTWHPPQGQENLFFQASIHSTIFSAIKSEFRARLGPT